MRFVSVCFLFFGGFHLTVISVAVSVSGFDDFCHFSALFVCFFIEISLERVAIPTTLIPCNGKRSKQS